MKDLHQKLCRYHMHLIEVSGHRNYQNEIQIDEDLKGQYPRHT